MEKGKQSRRESIGEWNSRESETVECSKSKRLWKFNSVREFSQWSELFSANKGGLRVSISHAYLQWRIYGLTKATVEPGAATTLLNLKKIYILWFRNAGECEEFSVRRRHTVGWHTNRFMLIPSSVHLVWLLLKGLVFTFAPRNIYCLQVHGCSFNIPNCFNLRGKIISLTLPFSYMFIVYLYFQAILNGFSIANVKENIFHVRLFPVGCVS